ncbi:hypothetical protein HYPDE_29038 [Hyphomicrobium denitrificans 1NES1]|uniref:Uncharacterized protein n=1 Tax=Hyphomicrobium denitrificans 1NES1 TaxID=670307 RepID=N0BAD7_9HYPH|nr:UDP-2,3-diacylglucosamine diphosphatase LpxI [Hyphomicrobium denitrificans]AGK57486.1 hypothetical protein HYPDE_29038 [Hyphomicrobium denitrificans 1NES1]
MTGPADRIGIIAGSGSLPREVAENIVSRGGSVHVVMVSGAADASLAMFPHTVVNWAQPGRATAALKTAGVRDVVLLGGFQRPDFRTARPDLAFFQALPSVLRFLKAGGDDAVLRGLVALFERRGLNIVGVRDVANDLTVAEGVLAGPALSVQNAADAEKGFALIAALGRYDIGQAAVVANGRVEAIEGAEGTDRMLRRVAEVRRATGAAGSGGVLVKRPKPGQDLRVDLPAIGPNTIENVAAAGLSGVAVMAEHVLAAERDRMMAIAEARGVSVVGMSQGQKHSAPSGEAVGGAFGWLGSVPIDARGVADIRRGAGILAVVSAFDTSTAVVLDRGRVMAAGTAERPVEVVERAAGLRKGDGRRGVVVIDPSQRLDEALLRTSDRYKFAGVAMVGDPMNTAISSAVVQLADSLGMFIAEVGNPSHDGARGRA